MFASISSKILIEDMKLGNNMKIKLMRQCSNQVIYFIQTILKSSATDHKRTFILPEAIKPDNIISAYKKKSS